MQLGDYKFTLSDVREGGENPPLPRNCKRGDLGQTATGATLWEGGLEFVDA